MGKLDIYSQSEACCSDSLKGIKMSKQEIIVLLIGAAISLFSSLITLMVTNAINRAGRIRIFYRFVGLKDYTSGWGFYGGEEGGIKLIIPTLYEIQNTKNTPFVMRDVNLALYMDNKFVSEMIQITDGEKEKHNNIRYGVDNKSYSFVIEPHSIQKISCLYMLIINQDDKEKKFFNAIKMVYYNERNRRVVKNLKSINGDWNINNLGSEIKWNKV